MGRSKDNNRKFTFLRHKLEEGRHGCCQTTAKFMFWRHKLEDDVMDVVKWGTATQILYVTKSAPHLFKAPSLVPL